MGEFAALFHAPYLFKLPRTVKCRKMRLLAVHQLNHGMRQETKLKGS